MCCQSNTVVAGLFFRRTRYDPDEHGDAGDFAGADKDVIIVVVLLLVLVLVLVPTKMIIIMVLIVIIMMTMLLLTVKNMIGVVNCVCTIIESDRTDNTTPGLLSTRCFSSCFPEFCRCSEALVSLYSDDERGSGPGLAAIKPKCVLRDLTVSCHLYRVCDGDCQQQLWCWWCPPDCHRIPFVLSGSTWLLCMGALVASA